MKEDLQEKAQFFAQYWGQYIYRQSNWNLDGRPDYPSWQVKALENHENLKRAFLELKPLSMISNEDAKKVWDVFKIKEKEAGYDTSWRELKAEILKAGELGINLFDFYGFQHNAFDILRSLGYVVSWKNHTVEQLIEKGWVELIK